MHLDWDRLETQAKGELEPLLAEYQALGRLGLNVLDGGIKTASASKRKFSKAPQVQAILIARIACDLRTILRDAETGYVSQAFTQASALFEHAHVTMYVGGDDERGQAWVDWDNRWRSFPGLSQKDLITVAVKAMSPVVYPAESIEREVARRLRVSSTLGTGKHGLPRFQHAVHAEATTAGLTVRVGPWADEKTTVYVRLCILYAVEFALLAAAFFIGQNFQSDEVGTLLPEIRAALEEMGRLRARDLSKRKAAP